MSNSPPNLTIETAQHAFQCFRTGLATAQWQPFLDMLTEDFTFWFPAGPYQGLNSGKAKAAQFFQLASKIFEPGLSLSLERMTYSESTVVFEVRSEGLMFGHPYENQAAISFEVRGDKICAYREYLGVIFQLPPSP